MLEAWRLKLGAWYCILFSICDLEKTMSLVLAITHSLNVPVPACTAIFALVALFGRRAAGVVA